MGREDVFNAVKSVASIYGGFFKDVAEEIGMERALALHAKQGEGFGVMLAGMVRDQLGDKEFDMKTFSSVYSGAYEGFGFTYEMEESHTSILVKAYQCPLYEGFKMAGLDDKTIESMCSLMSAAEYAEIKKVYPELTGRVKFRTAPDKPCVEEFLLEK